MTLASSMLEGLSQGVTQYAIESRQRTQQVVPSVVQPVAETALERGSVSIETIVVGAAGIGLGAMVARNKKDARSSNQIEEIRDLVEEIREEQVSVRLIDSLKNDIRDTQIPVMELVQAVGEIREEQR